MLMAHPVVLKDLVEQYETLRALHAEDGSAEARQLPLPQFLAVIPAPVAIEPDRCCAFGG
ncbi:DUF5133 domain-containing protein [Streptomyces sp. NPDC005904]|uniref:DUF5133 domain-containing protein n=1 Tax=Streptomyces sp. NPDC005904 TaxID=3154570 RepID=UPI0033E54FD0